MKISPDNPHYHALKKSLRDEWYLEHNSVHTDTRASIIGISLLEYKTLRKEFLYLNEQEIEHMIENTIAWYQAGKEIRKIVCKI